MKTQSFFYVALGGFFGAISRYILTLYFAEYLHGQSIWESVILTHENPVEQTISELNFFSSEALSLYFLAMPSEILLVNCIGSFFLGYFMYAFTQNGKNSKPWQVARLIFAVGFLGTFTTFASFTLDNIFFLLPFLTETIIHQDLLEYYTQSYQSLVLLEKILLEEKGFLLFFIHIFLQTIFCFVAVILGYNLGKIKK